MARWLVARFPGGEMTGYPIYIYIYTSDWSGVNKPLLTKIGASRERNGNG